MEKSWSSPEEFAQDAGWFADDVRLNPLQHLGKYPFTPTQTDHAPLRSWQHLLSDMVKADPTLLDDVGRLNDAVAEAIGAEFRASPPRIELGDVVPISTDGSVKGVQARLVLRDEFMSTDLLDLFYNERP